MTHEMTLLKRISALLIVPLLLAAPVAARPARTEPSVIISSRQADPSGALDYWTPARMAAARPATATTVAPVPVTATERSTAQASEASYVEPVSPQYLATSGVKLVRNITGGGSLPYTRQELVNATLYPFSTHGKLFFHGPDGWDYVCSATVIASPEQNLVATAGHCVYDSDMGEFATKVVFVPAYDNGDEPFGAWTARELHVLSNYATNGSLRYDFALAEMKRDASGRHIQQVVGARGAAFNIDPSALDAFGYPAGWPFDGETMQMCESEQSIRDGSGSMAPVGIGCDMTEGSSGGGWISSGNYLSTVTSYGYVGIPDKLYGPYLGDAALELYQAAAGDGPVVSSSTLPSAVTHIEQVSLKLSGGLKAAGTVSASGAICSSDARVAIFRMMDEDTGRLVGSAATNDDGSYSKRLKNKAGRYVAYTPAGWSGDEDLCSGALSAARRHRG